MKYNKIYFMHIHKTGGRHIIATVRDAMLETLNENDIKIIKRPNTHGGWHSEVDEQTYVFTVLRDPVEQAVSLYAHQISLNKMGDIKDEYDKSKLTKEHFFSWLQEKDLYESTYVFYCSLLLLSSICRIYLYWKSGTNERYEIYDGRLFLQF